MDGQKVQLEKGVAVSLASDTTFSVPNIIYVGTGGTVKVDLWDSGTGLSFANAPSGFALPYLVKKVYSTANGTTATDLIASPY